MAFAAVGIIGTAQSSTANQSSLVLTTTNTLEAGNLGVLCVGFDNTQTTDGDEGGVTGVVDSAGNTWAKAKEHCNGQGAAKAGTTVSMWFVKAGTQLTAGGTITISFSNAADRDKTCATAYEFTASSSIAVEATNQISDDGVAPSDLNATTANIECLRVRATSTEDTSAAILSSPGFTNWQSPTITSVTTGGGAAANQGVRAEHKISTGTSDISQPAMTTAADHASIYVAFREIAAAIGSASGTGASSPIGHSIVSRQGRAFTVGHDRVIETPQTCLLHFDGPDGYTASDGLLDATMRNRFRLHGNAQIDTAQSKFGGASLLLDGTGDYATRYPYPAGFTDHPSDTGFVFGTGEFTVDFWIRFANVTGQQDIIGFHDGDGSGPAKVLKTSGNKFAWNRDVTDLLTGTTTVAIDTWYHVAITRSGTTSRLFVNGAVEASATDTYDYTAPRPAVPVIGSSGGSSPGNFVNGWIDEVRIIKGTAAWTAAFTAPAAAYSVGTGQQVVLIHADGVDGSTSFSDVARRHPLGAVSGAEVDTAQSKFGGASALFPGSTNNELTIFAGENVYMPDLTFEGDFTIDFWFRHSVNQAAGGGVLLHMNSGESLFMSLTDTNDSQPNRVGGFGLVGTTQTSHDTWHHVALTRQAGVVRLFVNGTQEGGTLYNDKTVGGAAQFQIVNFGNHATSTGWEYTGWLDEIRIVKGEAVWTSNFTAPTAPYTVQQAPVLLLHMDGADASTTFTDASGHKHPVTVNGNAQIDTAQSVFGGASALFDGTGDYLDLDGSSAFAFGTGDYTIDFWARFDTLGAAFDVFQMFDFRSSALNETALAAYVTYAGQIAVDVGNGALEGSATGLVIADTWHHLAFVRRDGVFQCYLDGTLRITKAHTHDLVAVSNRPRFGARGDAASAMTGWIEELRIIKGHAAYTSNFNPPTAPYVVENDGQSQLIASSYGDAASPSLPRLELLLHADGVDGATGASAFVDSAGRYTGGRLFVNSSPAIDTGQIKFGTSSIQYSGNQDIGFSDCPLYERDFTMDFWVRRSSGARTNLLGFNLADGINWLAVWVNSSDKLVATIGSAASNTDIVGTTTFTSNAWHHIALTRSGNSFRLFLNGVQEGSTYTASVNFGAPQGALGTWAGADYLTGHIDEFRIVLGHAAWTAAFTAPTAPHPNLWPPTIALLHADGEDGSTRVIDSATRPQNVFSVFGDAQLDTAQSKFGGSSLLLDGTGDSIYPTSYNPDDFGFPGDFTIDLWIRLASLTPDTQCIIEQRTDNPGYILEKRANESVRFSTLDGVLLIESAANSLTLNTWHHVAVTRSGGDVRLFIDGTVAASQSSYTTAVPTPASGYPVIGLEPGTSTNVINGHIDELRILRGRAAWTANFTPPTAQYTGTDLDFCVLMLHFDGADASTVIKDDSYAHRNGWIVGQQAQLDTAQSKFGGSSFSFDGAGDFLAKAGLSSDWDFNGDWTFECWIRRFEINVDHHIVDGRLNTSDTTSKGLQLYVRSDNNKIEFDVCGTGGAGTGASVPTINADTWYHVRLTRSGNSVRLYIDGVADTNGGTATAAWTKVANRPLIGIRSDFNVGFKGWIEEVSFINGYAKNTGTGSFTPPTLPFRLQQAEAVGEAVVASDSGAGSAAGIGAATAVGASTAAADGDADGLGAATAVGVGLAIADGAAAGTGAATGIGAAIFSAAAMAAGASTTPGVVFLLHADGSDGSTTFTDASGRSSVSAVGNAQVDTAQSVFGGASALFDGSGDYVAFNCPDKSLPGDFTLDFWVRLAGTTGGFQNLIDIRGGNVNGPLVGFDPTNMRPYYYAQNAAQITPAASIMSYGQWYHIAVTRSGSSTKLFLDGTQVGSTYTDSTNFNLGAVGSIGGTNEFFSVNGHIDEVRLVVGSAEWTSNFTPPSSAYSIEPLAVGVSIFSGVGSAAGTGNASGVMTSTAEGVGNAAGTGAASAESEGGSLGDADGTGAASGVGTGIVSAAGAASGTGTATATGAATASGDGSASGTGAATATGMAFAAGAGDADGTGAASGVGASTAASVGNAAGIGAAAGQSEPGQLGDADGTGAAAAVGTAVMNSVGDADGTGTATGAGAAEAASVGNAAGTGTAAGLSEAGSMANAAGTGAASGVGEHVMAATGVAAGTGAASGVDGSLTTTSAVGAAVGVGAANAFTEDLGSQAIDRHVTVAAENRGVIVASESRTVAVVSEGRNAEVV